MRIVGERERCGTRKGFLEGVDQSIAKCLDTWKTWIEEDKKKFREDVYKTRRNIKHLIKRGDGVKEVKMLSSRGVEL